MSLLVIMVEKNWIKRHPVWTGVIGVVVLFILIGLFSGGDNTQQTTDNEENGLIAPTQEEIEIHDYYSKILFQETDKFYDAQDEGLTYEYNSVIVQDQSEIEDLVRIDVAQKFGISEEELDNIYIRVEAYNNQ